MPLKNDESAYKLLNPIRIELFGVKWIIVVV